MPLPASVTPITLTGTFQKLDGTPDTGRVTVKSKWFVQSGVEDVVLTPYFVTTALDANGHFSLILPANNDTGWSPTGWSYEVAFYLSGGVDDRSITLDKAVAGATIDIADLSPGQSPSLPVFYVLVSEKGVPNGVATLDSAGQVPAEQLANAPGGVGGSTPDATTLTKGKVQLAGDLSGTAALPTVPGLATKANDSAVVHKTGAETVAGVKTFSSLPTVPTPPVVGTDASSKQYVDDGLATKADASATATALSSKADDSAVVHKTGAETVAGVKTFTSLPTIPTPPIAGTDAAAKTYVDNGLSAKADDSTVVHKTGAETVAGVKTFTSLPTIPTPPVNGTDAAAKTYVDNGLSAKADDSTVVHKTGAETIAGVKTFSSLPTIPTPPVAGTDAAAKTYVDNGLSTKADDSAVVHKTGAETVAGVKTFSSLPTIPTPPVSGTDASSKQYVDDGLALKVPTTRTITAGTGLSGGGDLSANRTLAVVDNTSIQKVDVAKAGTLTGSRKRVNFIDGANVTVTTADNSGSDRVDVTVAATTPYTVFAVSQGGVLDVSAGKGKLYNDSGRTLTIQSVRVSVDTSPVGAALKVDFNLSGTTIFTTQANRPVVADGSATKTSGKVTNMDVTAWPDGSYLSVDIDQIGSTTPGSDMTAQVWAA